MRFSLFMFLIVLTNSISSVYYTELVDAPWSKYFATNASLKQFDPYRTQISWLRGLVDLISFETFQCQFPTMSRRAGVGNMFGLWIIIFCSRYDNIVTLLAICSIAIQSLLYICTVDVISQYYIGKERTKKVIEFRKQLTVLSLIQYKTNTWRY